MTLPKNRQQGEGLAITLFTIVAVILVIIIVSKSIKGLEGLFEAMGLKDSKEEREDKQYIEQQTATGTGVAKAFSANLWKEPGATLFTQSLTDSLVKMLWDSVGNIYDTPSMGATAIKRCETKSQVSWLAFNFAKKHGIDLLTWLKQKYDTESQRDILASMLSHVEALPTFKK